MIATLVETSHDIRDAYAKARAAMEKLEFTRGTPLSRGTSLAYKTTLERMFLERDFAPDEEATWPAMVEQITSFLLDMRSEYARAYSSAFGDDAREQIEQVTGTLESLNDAVRRTVHWEAKPVGAPAEEPEEAPSLVEEHPAIKHAYKAAMRAMQEAAGDVENREGRGYRCALGRIVSDTCELKNLGYSIQYFQNERRETALLILDMVSLEYSELYYRTDSPEDEKYKAASDAIHELRRTVSEHLPKEER